MNPVLLKTASQIDLNKVIKFIIVIVAIIIGVRYLKRYLKTIKNKSVLNRLDKDINVNYLSYPLSYFALWATDVFNAMSGMGTDEQAIYNVFGKLRSKDDVLQLITAFGVKDGQTLNQWIANDLDNSERETLNRLLVSLQTKVDFLS